MQKNDIIELKIEDMGVDGEGIGKYDGMTFFVKDAVLGYHRMELIRQQAIEETRAARQRARGLTPTIREARAIENEFAGQLMVGEVRGATKTRAESKTNYDAMMGDLFQAMDAEVMHD